MTTAIEFLVSKVWLDGDVEPTEYFKKIIHLAKKMEEKHIKDAFIKGFMISSDYPEDFNNNHEQDLWLSQKSEDYYQKKCKQ